MKAGVGLSNGSDLSFLIQFLLLFVSVDAVERPSAGLMSAAVESGTQFKRTRLSLVLRQFRFRPRSLRQDGARKRDDVAIRLFADHLKPDDAEGDLFVQPDG